ncbi:HepT-like ribonuclease domain-containing protein [uncultured Agrobacterium sp.]|uniref:HepT-like ribonuclease domain-containing protein n=1 Tax=uncultured Agrobacterium sp. TaxID=157277 RepID=UPI00258EAF58|nr:HepT-like ribonuclease domain-containing protein [uncultured Agrobacterium sp.]
MAMRSNGPVLSEMLDAIIGIKTHTFGKSLTEFEQDWLLKLAVQRALEIISEAARHLPDDLTALAPDVPWKQIRGIGNILRHEYHKIADDVVWAVVTDHIQPLEDAVRLMMRAPAANSPSP